MNRVIASLTLVLVLGGVGFIGQGSVLWWVMDNEPKVEMDQVESIKIDTP